MVESHNGKTLVAVFTFAVLAILGLTAFNFNTKATPNFTHQSTKSSEAEDKAVLHTRPRDKLQHLLLPASNPDVNLCKTLLTAAILDYPTPTLIAWNKTFDQGYLLGGGSHVAKISGVLKYLEALDRTADDELVLMMDAYDIWFQLPAEILVSRYHDINAKADDRLVKRLGSAAHAENLQQSIIFGAGKRCAPNQPQTVACYPLPESPLPSDVYGANTDTIMGSNRYTSTRQRYLNSGYILGPVGDMRKMFRRAQEKVDAVKDHSDWDNGSGTADFMYHGSDQSIFNSMLGEQEFQREVMRRRHRTTSDKLRGVGKAPKPTWIEGTLVEDPLNPSFTHEPWEAKAGKPDEFGMGLDYFSELGQQTANAERDGRWVVYNGNVTRQTRARHMYDCPSRVTPTLPADISTSRPPYGKAGTNQSHDALVPIAGWRDVPLYTNVCLDTIPVMIHHNGDKAARERNWRELWLQPHARALLRNVTDPNGESSRGKKGGTQVGAMDGSSFLTWKELCPRRMEAELFRNAD